MLKSYIQIMKENWEEERHELTKQIKTSFLEKSQDRDFGTELRDSVDMRSLQAVAEDIRKQLVTKEALVDEMYFRNQQLEIVVASLKQELTENAKRIMKSEGKLRQQMEISRQLQMELYNIRNNRSEMKTKISFANLESEKMAKMSFVASKQKKEVSKQKTINFQ